MAPKAKEKKAAAKKPKKAVKPKKEKTPKVEAKPDTSATGSNPNPDFEAGVIFNK